MRIVLPHFVLQKQGSLGLFGYFTVKVRKIIIIVLLEMSHSVNGQIDSKKDKKYVCDCLNNQKMQELMDEHKAYCSE